MIRSRPLLLALAAATVALGGCSSVNLVDGDKVDYRSGGVKTPGLDVPPDLTQLARDNRYQTTGGAISASALQAPAPAAGGRLPAAATSVAPQPSSDLRIERLGDKRFLVTTLPPEQLWPQLQGFWKDRGFTLVVEQPETGVMETEWAENRAKLPNDWIRRTIGGLIDGLYSTGERDKFRTRIERTATGSEVYITHRGLVEVYSSQLRDATSWQPRPADPELEAEFLSRLMVRLGAKEEVARTATAAPAAAAAPRARVLDGQPGATLQVDDGFERAWRRVGVALDRTGFTVEDRDRAQGVYFVRFVTANAGVTDERGFFARMFGSAPAAGGPQRYRVFVQGQGERSTVAVLNAQGAPESSDVGKRIVALLVDDLK